MLESMRKHAQGWIAKVILGAIILSFALWGVGDYFTGNQIETVAEVDGEVIHHVEFLETYQRQLNSYRNMLGEQFTKELADQLGIKNETIQTMVNRRLMLLEAESMGLVVPDKAVLGAVQANPAFQQDKSFDTTRYQGLIRQMGFVSPRDYENYLRQSMMIETLQKGIIEGAEVSDAEVKAQFKAKFEKRVLEALVVNPAVLEPAIEVSDEQARAWYDSHASQYQSVLKVALQVVDINAAEMNDIVVSDSDVEQSYAERQSEYVTAEKRRASHILVRVARDASADVLAAAQTEIEAAQQRLAAGEAFADVAKDVSADVTAAEGGNLGFFAKGAMVAEFEDVVFNALNVGEVSDVIRTQFGLHLIQLNEIQPESVQPLADVREALHAELWQQAAANEAYRLSEDLDNALGMEGSLKEAAASVNLSMRDLGALSADQMLADVLLAVSKDLQKRALSMQPGDAIEIVEVGDSRFVALEVIKRINPQTMAYADVVSRVYASVRADQARKQAQGVADQILEAAMAGGDIDALAQQFAQPKYISKPVLSNGEGDASAWVGAVLPVSFRTPESSWVGSTVVTAQGIAVIFVQDVEAADEELFIKESEAVRNEAIKAKGAVRFARWMASVRDRHEIVVNERVLERF